MFTRNAIPRRPSHLNGGWKTGRRLIQPTLSMASSAHASSPYFPAVETPPGADRLMDAPLRSQPPEASVSEG
ncbi:hypothetical protein FA13DRAFT_1733342 [Coprinellus micaceus]|uniref:Uncharacterized protein n=1 Tax=Coprinellus micaceus TaxID=71717 RepID=A0A4Y7T9T3_COPMI|nr:hypothetical protein FA13DRAFT_1733342 [Coprinellus micaceus]